MKQKTNKQLESDAYDKWYFNTASDEQDLRNAFVAGWQAHKKYKKKSK